MIAAEINRADAWERLPLRPRPDLARVQRRGLRRRRRKVKAAHWVALAADAAGVGDVDPV